MHDIDNTDDIKVLVDSFYIRVLADPVIGFIFNDVIPISWEHHMPVMYAFWGSVLLGSDTYHSNPMTKHIAMNRIVPLEQEHFDRWLELWEMNVRSLFSGENTEQAITRARNIASLMLYKVQQSNKLQ